MMPVQQVYSESVDLSIGKSDTLLPNQQYLIEILTAQRSGDGCLPLHLGLNEFEFKQLANRHFKGLKQCVSDVEIFSENNEIRQELLDLRQTEWQDLVNLLNNFAKGADLSEHWLAQIIAAGCMGSDHLWRDLGLPDRHSLRELFMDNFPALADKNTGDMRWKKFLYRQLCEQGGHFICRSPSCDACPTYNDCFGDEA